jgi:hypothetical protein
MITPLRSRTAAAAQPCRLLECKCRTDQRGLTRPDVRRHLPTLYSRYEGFEYASRLVGVPD